MLNGFVLAFGPEGFFAVVNEDVVGALDGTMLSRILAVTELPSNPCSFNHRLSISLKINISSHSTVTGKQSRLPLCGVHFPQVFPFRPLINHLLSNAPPLRVQFVV